MKYRLHVDFCSDRARYMVLPAIFYRGAVMYSYQHHIKDFNTASLSGVRVK